MIGLALYFRVNKLSGGKYMKSLVALMVFGLFLFLGTTSHAQTPDGETPAVEDVCEGYAGQAYGLCNAYCEAMDCDGEPRASEKACARVQANFENKTGEILPCLLEGCDNPSNLGKPCDDMSACTINDTCQLYIDGGLQCIGDALDCDDGNSCTLDDCDVIEGCFSVNEPVDFPCDDGDSCTQGEVCDENGACAGGIPICMER